MSTTWAKIAGWLQFGMASIAQIGQMAQQGAMPHGFWAWFGLAGSFLTAVAVHHASNTDGTK